MSKRILTVETGEDHPREINFGKDTKEIHVWYRTDIGPIEERYIWDVERDAFRCISRKMLTDREWERREEERRKRDVRPATTGYREGRVAS